MTDKSHDVRRGLASAHSMHRTNECSGSLALINRLRQEGRLYQLTSHQAPAGTRIHQRLARKDINGPEDVCRRLKNGSPICAKVWQSKRFEAGAMAPIARLLANIASGGGKA